MAASPNAGAQRAQQVDEDAQGEGDVQAEPADVQGEGHEGDSPPGLWLGLWGLSEHSSVSNQILSGEQGYSLCFLCPLSRRISWLHRGIVC